MKSHELLDAIGEAQDMYVLDAKASKKKHTSVWVKWVAVAACLCLIVTLFPIMQSMMWTEQPHNPTETLDKPIDMNAPVHFYLDGKVYCYHGEITKALPEGYEYIGEIKNVGDTFSGKDFEGNADGKIYMNGAVADIAYFSWAEWNETADGPAPFLMLERSTE